MSNLSWKDTPKQNVNLTQYVNAIRDLITTGAEMQAFDLVEVAVQKRHNFTLIKNLLEALYDVAGAEVQKYMLSVDITKDYGHTAVASPRPVVDVVSAPTAPVAEMVVPVEVVASTPAPLVTSAVVPQNGTGRVAKAKQNFWQGWKSR